MGSQGFTLLRNESLGHLTRQAEIPTESVRNREWVVENGDEENNCIPRINCEEKACSSQSH